MKHSLRDALPRWLLTWLVSVALAAGLGLLLRVDSRWWLAAPVLLLWCGGLAVAERFGRFWAMLALWAAALGLCLLLADPVRLGEAALAALAREGVSNGYGELALLLLCATFALPLSALLRLYWARAALSLGWTALWVAAALAERALPRLLPAAMLPLLLLTLAETIRRIRRGAETDQTFRRALLLSLLPAALLLGLLPASAEPYGYPLLRSVADAVEQLWHDAETSLRYRHGGDGEFGLSFNGVSDEAKLGEGIEESRPSIIYANPTQATDGAVYLFGNAWDHFDGRSWSSTLKAEDAELLNWRMDTAEHVYALWRLLNAEGPSAQASDYFRLNSVYLNCQNMNVRTMFGVMNETRVYTDAKRFPYADAPTGSLFDYVQRNTVWYRIYYLESNARTRGALITASEGTIYDADAHVSLWNRVTQDLERDLPLDLKVDANLEKALARRETLIRSVCLDTTGVSDRARALAEEITAPCGSDYEKAAAIAAYLQTHYRYNLRPDPVPKEENFLDRLLFESREGYCTWYATAAVLLCRSVGVPSRFVQGYRGELAGEVYTPLDSRYAHAWCECYIGGYGWVTVEATPGFESDGTGWLTAAEEQALRDSAPAPREEHSAEETGGRDPAALLPAPSGRTGSADEPASEPEPAAARFSWLLALIPVVLLGALTALGLWLRARKKRRYAAADPATRLQLDLERLLRDLRGKGYPRRPEESLRLYFARLPWHYLLAREAEAEEMAALYDRCFFAQETPSEAELARHRAFAARFRPKTLRQWMIWYSLQ